MAYTSFRPTDNRTVTSYTVRDGKILASDSNYCVEQLKNSRNPVVKDGRIFSGETDTTCAVILELSEYADYDFTDIIELQFLGKKGNIYPKEVPKDVIPHPCAFSNQILSDILVTALKGGSNNWYFINTESDRKIRKYKDSQHPQNQMNCFSEHLFVALDNGEEIQIHDIEETDDLLGTLTKESLIKAVILLQENYKELYDSMLEEDHDADTGIRGYVPC